MASRPSTPVSWIEHDYSNIPTGAPTPNYLAQIRVDKSRSPTVTRLLSVPVTFTFWDLHCAAESALHWPHSTQYGFQVIEDLTVNSARAATRSRPRVLLYLSPSEKFRLVDIFNAVSNNFGRGLLYHHRAHISWEIHVALIGRAREFTNGKVVCLSRCGHPPTTEMSTPQVMMQYNVEYKKASTEKELKVA